MFLHRTTAVQVVDLWTAMCRMQRLQCLCRQPSRKREFAQFRFNFRGFCWVHGKGGLYPFLIWQILFDEKVLMGKMANIFLHISASHTELQTDFTFLILLDSLTAYRLVMSNLPEAISALWFQLFLCKNRNPWITQLVMSDDSTIQVL